MKKLTTMLCTAAMLLCSSCAIYIPFTVTDSSKCTNGAIQTYACVHHVIDGDTAFDCTAMFTDTILHKGDKVNVNASLFYGRAYAKTIKQGLLHCNHVPR